MLSVPPNPFTGHVAVRLSLAHGLSVTKAQATSRKSAGEAGEALCWCPSGWDGGSPTTAGSLGGDGHTQRRNNVGVWFLTLDPPNQLCSACLQMSTRETNKTGRSLKPPVLASSVPKWPLDSLYHCMHTPLQGDLLPSRQWPLDIGLTHVTPFG